MKVNADLRLKDVPGQLVGALEPISRFDGNIRGVLHDHDQKVGGRIAVNVTFEVRTEQALDKILGAWKSMEVDVARIDSHLDTMTSQFLLVGKIDAKELEALTAMLESMRNVSSMDIRYSGSGTSPSRAAMVTWKASSREAAAKLERSFRERAEKNGYLLIRGLDS